MSTTPALTPVRREVTVTVGPARAFQIFTMHFDSWWPRGHHIGAAELYRVVVEPQVGGRWYEIGTDGAECEWGRVLAWDPPNRLLLAWQLNGNFAYDPDPAHASEVEVTFEATDDGTVVTLEHRHLERMVDGQAGHSGISGEGGWTSLLGSYAAVVAAGAD